MSNPSDADCERISRMLMEQSADGYRKNTANIEAECQASIRRLLPDLEKAVTLFKTIEETDFLNEDSRTTLCDMLSTNIHSYIALGMYVNHHYCLNPDILQIVPEDYDIDETDSREILPGSILGINLIKTNLGPRNRRKDAESDESASSNSSTGNDDTGFTFMQLGRADHLLDSSRTRYEKESQYLAEMPWSDSGFVLVVAIEQNGKAGAPWLLFNFKPKSEIEGDRVTIPRTDTYWGTLLGDQTQRVAMKIGEKMSDLKDKKAWDLTKIYGMDYTTQIVAAVLSRETSPEAGSFGRWSSTATAGVAKGGRILGVVIVLHKWW